MKSRTPINVPTHNLGDTGVDALTSWECDILGVVESAVPEWIDYRSRRIGEWLGGHGISHAATSSAALTIESLSKNPHPRVVIDEACVIPPVKLRQFALAFPDTTFVALYHGSMALLANVNAEGLRLYLELVEEFPNVKFGVVDDPLKYPWPAGVTPVHLPNLVHIPEGVKRSKYDGKGPLRVSLVSRMAQIKNVGGMMLALGALAQRRQVEGLIVINNPKILASISAVASKLGVAVDARPFGPWDATIQAISECHVGLTCSLSDSFNLTAAEHCLLGIPVVGSYAVDWLPESWKCSPQHPMLIADVVEKLAVDPRAGAKGKKIALAIAAENERILLSNMRALLGR